MASDMTFWSATVKKEAVVDIEQTESTAQYIHVTNVALGKSPADGPHTVLLTSGDGKETVIATLQKGVCFQHGMDLVLDSTTIITNTGGSAVHLAGYMTYSSAEDYDSQSESEDDEDDEAPQAVPIGGKAKKQAARVVPASDSEDGDEDEEEEEDEEDDDEDDDIPRGLKASSFPFGRDGKIKLNPDDVVGEFGSDGDDDMDESDEDEDFDGEGEDEDEELDEDEDEDEEEEKPAPAKAAAGAKRPVVGNASTPAAKKVKVEANGKKVPASAPAKVQEKPGKTKQEPVKAAAGASAVVSKDAAGYEKALIEFLKNGKPQTLAAIGSSVKRPSDVPKLGGFLKSRASLFKVDEKAGTVALK